MYRIRTSVVCFLMAAIRLSPRLENLHPPRRCYCCHREFVDVLIL